MAIWHVAPLRFAPAFRALGVCEHIWLRYKNFDPSCFDPIQKFGIVDLRTNSDFRSRSFDLFPPTHFIGESPTIVDLRRIGKFKSDQKRPRTLLVCLSNPWDVKKNLSKGYMLKEYGKPIFLSRALNREEQTLEHELIKTRRELINAGESPKNIGYGTICRKTICRKLTQGQFADFFSANCPWHSANWVSSPNMGSYTVYARLPSPSQRPAPTTIASRSPFPLGLCSCSTSLSKMGT